jgi:hypothetical protein
MKELIEIAKILDRKKLSKIEIFDQQNLRQDNKLTAFYQALQNGEFFTDADAAAVLYDTAPSDDRYRQIKSRFRRKLLNTFFFLGVAQPQKDDYQAFLYHCRRQLALVHILQNFGATQTALSEALQLQQAALKYKFAEIITDTARILRAWYAEQNDEKAFAGQNALIQQYMPVWESEQRSEELLLSVRMVWRAENNLSKTESDQIAAYANEALALSAKYDSPDISLSAFEIWMLQFEMEGDFHAAAEAGSQAEQYMNDHPTRASKDKKFLFSLGQLRAALHTRDFKKGRAIAEQAFRNASTGDPEWLKIMELYLLLNIHADNVLNAFAIFREAVSSKAVRNLPPEEQGNWDIFAAYVHFLMSLRPADQQFTLLPKEKQFQVQDFIEARVPYLPQKQNQTILIAIAQILFLFQTGRFNAASQQIEWLYKLSKTLERSKNFRRQILFIRLLNLLKTSDYRPSEMKKKEALLQELSQTPFRYRGGFSRLEIIPYEKLWEIVAGFFK